MSNEENAKQWLEDCGKQTTITIEPNAEGIQVGVNFGGDKFDPSNPTIAQGLALVGVDAIRKSIREMLEVKSEEVSANENHIVKSAVN